MKIDTKNDTITVTLTKEQWMATSAALCLDIRQTLREGGTSLSDLTNNVDALIVLVGVSGVERLVREKVLDNAVLAVVDSLL